MTIQQKALAITDIESLRDEADLLYWDIFINEDTDDRISVDDVLYYCAICDELAKRRG